MCSEWNYMSGSQHVGTALNISCADNYLPVGAVAKYCDEHVCESVCLSVRKDISGTTRDLWQFFCACCLWPWLGPPLAG